MEYFKIIGTGMGLEQYMLPEAVEGIKEADILVGGERNLEPWKDGKKELFIIKNNLKDIVEFIESNYRNKSVVVLVSGDPGFYSMLTFLSKHFDRKVMRVIPGISSMQMAFARVSLAWHDAKLLNLHGRKIQILDDNYHEEKIGMLTDPINNPIVIAKYLLDLGKKGSTVFICTNLGYNDEEIIEFKIEDFDKISIDKNKPSVMIVLDEEN